MAIIALAIPFTVLLSQQTQIINQHASIKTSTPATAPGTVPLGIQAGQPIDDNGNILITSSVASRMAASGSKWIRVNFRLGPYASDTPQFYTAYDSIVSLLTSKGLQVVGLMSNESWQGSQTDWTANNWEIVHGNGENTYIDNFCLEFARMALHYQGQITYWEIWNEPNAYTTPGSGGVYTGGTFIYPSN